MTACSFLWTSGLLLWFAVHVEGPGPDRNHGRLPRRQINPYRPPHPIINPYQRPSSFLKPRQPSPPRGSPNTRPGYHPLSPGDVSQHGSSRSLDSIVKGHEGRPLAQHEPQTGRTFTLKIWLLKGVDLYLTKIPASNRVEHKKISSFQVGNPPQKIMVALDTGSYNTWIRAHRTPKDPSGYNPVESTTKMVPRPFERGMSSRWNAKGYGCYDYFSFGQSLNEQLPWQFKFLLVDDPPSKYEGLPSKYDGAFGLAYDPRNDLKWSVFQQTHEGREYLVEPMFTVYVKERENNEDDLQEAGLLTVGKGDEENCELFNMWVPLIEGHPFWMFEVRGIRFGGEKYEGHYPTITSTGSSHILLSQEFVDKIARKFGARIVDSRYRVQCTPGNYDLEFAIHHNVYKIPTRQLLKRLQGNECELLIRPTNEKHWTFGLPFARSYCQVHYWGPTTKGLWFSRPRQPSREPEN